MKFPSNLELTLVRTLAFSTRYTSIITSPRFNVPSPFIRHLSYPRITPSPSLSSSTSPRMDCLFAVIVNLARKEEISPPSRETARIPKFFYKGGPRFIERLVCGRGRG